MRIADNSTGTGIAIEREEGDSQELDVIATRIMPEWLALFQRKNRDYGSGSAYELGVRGQYSDIYRKMIKLKRAMWDGHDLDFEDTEEIIKDLISHLFLTLHMFGLQREAAAAYIYTEDDAAVDAFFRMVGGDAENALKMSGVLTSPFRELVRGRANNMIAEDRMEAMSMEAEGGFDAEQQGRMAERLKRGEAERLYGAREARRRSREADGSPCEPPVTARAETAAYRFRADGVEEGPMERLASDEFGESDFEQNGVVIGYNFEAAEESAKVGPPRIISETVDGRTRYYHEPFPGADREPLALVPKALIDRAQKDHYVMNKEQEAGLRTLADWADNQ